MKRNVLLGSCLAVVLGTAACQDQPTGPTNLAATRPAAPSMSSTALGRPDRGQLKLPAGAKAIGHRYCTELMPGAINPSDYECPASTAISDWWLNAALASYAAEPEIFELLYFDTFADALPTYDALIFRNESPSEYFGYNGEYTQVMLKTEKDARRFWDIRSDDIQLLGMHGTMLLDVERTAQVYAWYWEVSADSAAKAAAAIVDAMERSTTLNGGNHPLFSFNAFAFSTFGGPIPDKIVMGDGILAGYAALGFGDVAPQGVYMHEFAHHIQYENGYFEDEYATTGSAAEQTRYTELMADAMSAYFLTHKRGLALNEKRVAQFLEVFYQIGDCGFTSSGHHGTPNQRMAAAQFGFDLAKEALKQGQILTSEQVYQRFLAAYPSIIAPDAN